MITLVSSANNTIQEFLLDTVYGMCSLSVLLQRSHKKGKNPIMFDSAT